MQLAKNRKGEGCYRNFRSFAPRCVCVIAHTHTHTQKHTDTTKVKRRDAAYTLYNPLSPVLSCALNYAARHSFVYAFARILHKSTVNLCSYVCVCERVFISLRKFLNKQICQYFVYCLLSIRSVLLPVFRSVALIRRTVKFL